MSIKNHKTLLLGPATVGKTSISDRFRHINFDSRKDSTIGAAYAKITMEDVKLDLWDTAGQERFNSMVSFYYRDADVAILVFDVSNPDTIKKLHQHLVHLRDVSPNCNYIIVGNKIDLIEEKQLNEIKQTVRTNFSQYEHDDNLYYYYTSAKDNTNIDELVVHIINVCRLKRPAKDPGQTALVPGSAAEEPTDKTYWSSVSNYTAGVGSYCSLF